MRSTLIQLVLGVALVALLVANLAIGRSVVAERNFEFLPTMVHSVPYGAYTSHPDLPSGMTMQAPPDGTIARGRIPLRFEAGPEEALRAGAELENPLEESAENQERGGQLYGIYCQLCHGPDGRGDGTVARRGFPAPPNFNSETSTALEDGQIFHIITFGQNNMPGHASQIDPGDRWRVVQHVRALRSALVAELEPSEQVASENGEPAADTTQSSTQSDGEVQP